MDKLIYILALLIFIYIIKNDFTEKENFGNTIYLSQPDDLNSINVLSQLSKKLIGNNGVILPSSLTINGDVLAKGNMNLTNNVSSSSTITAPIATFTNLNLIPRGVISIWRPPIGDAIPVPPTGWAICDGTNGTPDLRGRFIVGADYTNFNYVLEKKSGNETVTLTKDNIPKHNHTSFIIKGMKNAYTTKVLNGIYPEVFSKDRDFNYYDMTNYLQTFNDRALTLKGRGDERLFVENTGEGIVDASNNLTTDGLIGYGGAPYYTGDGSEKNIKGNPINILPPYYAIYYIMKL